MLGYEYEPGQDANVSYNLHRDGQLIANVTDSTNYFDADGTASAVYSVAAVIGGVAYAASAEASAWGDSYIRIPLDSPGPNSANDASAADLDGDGEYEIILKWDANNA
jgi:rhamnogalacturonan endolyase